MTHHHYTVLARLVARGLPIFADEALGLHDDAEPNQREIERLQLLIAHGWVHSFAVDDDVLYAVTGLGRAALADEMTRRDHIARRWGWWSWVRFWAVITGGRRCRRAEPHPLDSKHNPEGARGRLEVALVRLYDDVPQERVDAVNQKVLDAIADEDPFDRRRPPS